MRSKSGELQELGARVQDVADALARERALALLVPRGVRAASLAAGSDVVKESASARNLAFRLHSVTPIRSMGMTRSIEVLKND